eukprot:Skav217375  [mRNA]  locus=scaffold5994:41375:41659:+ [translate_table: standard]
MDTHQGNTSVFHSGACLVQFPFHHLVDSILPLLRRGLPFFFGLFVLSKIFLLFAGGADELLAQFLHVILARQFVLEKLKPLRRFFNFDAGIHDL